MSHLPQSRAHYGGGGNVLCSHLVCLMADEWAEMGKLRAAVDGAAKQLNESGEVKASVSGEHPASSENESARGHVRLRLPHKENTDIQVLLNASFNCCISLC